MAEPQVALRSGAESALGKAWRRIIPLLSVCYLIAYMDRVNIGFAAESMNHDLRFSPQVYGLGAGLFFLSYAVCEIPANRLLLRFGARRWMARIMFSWGLLAAAMLLIRSAPQFYGMRLLLGAAEAGYFPGAIFYLTLWFPSRHRARAVSWFYISMPLSSVVMGAVAGGLLRLDGVLGLRGWQWLFLLEGLPAVLLSVAIWRRLPDGPDDAPWLTEEERTSLSREIHGNAVAQNQSRFGDVLRDRRMWLMCAFNLCMLVTNYAVSFFLPVVLRDLTRWSPGRVGFFIAGSGLAGAVSMVANATHSDRSGERTWHVAVPMCVLGLLAIFSGMHLHGGAAVVALLLLPVAYAALQGPVFAIIGGLFDGANGALAIATVNMVGMLGGFLGPYCMGWARQASGAYGLGIALLGVPCAAAVASVLWMRSPGRAVEAPALVAEV